MLVLVPVIGGTATGGGDDVDRWAALLVLVGEGVEAFAAETLLLPPPRSTSNSSTESKEAHAASAG